MGEIFLTSDTHIWHNKEFIYADRGFENIEEHNERLVENWNKTVGKNDTVYHLGDVIIKDMEQGMPILERLNGNIIIIRGNHDSEEKLKRYRESPNVIEAGQGAMYLKYDKYNFFLCHFPTLIRSDWRGRHMKTTLINLHGHTHQKENFGYDNPFMYHVGVDSHGLTPVHMDKVVKDIKYYLSSMPNE